MTEHKVKILKVGFITHDTKSFIVEKPKDYNFISGQATLVGIDDEKRPFTFTSTNNNLVLEFIIKKYFNITKFIHNLNSGDELFIEDPWGTINYSGEGVFIAGGAGITPFVSIFRDLKEKGKLGKNKLIFSNKTQKDIILEKELKELFKENLILTLTKEKKQDYENSRIDEEFLKKYIKNFNQKFYICGPEKFVEDIKNILEKVGAKTEEIIFGK